MAFTLHDSAAATAFGDDAAPTLTIEVTAGDLIVIAGGTLTEAIDVNSVADEDGNSYTVRASLSTGTGYTLTTGYCLAAGSTNATCTITFTFDAATARRTIYAASFTPTAAGTIALDTAAAHGGAWESSPWESAVFSTAGTDELVIAFAASSNSGTTYSNHEIPSGSAATVLESTQYGVCGWWAIFGSTQSNIIAEVDPSGSAGDDVEALAFKFTAAGGGLSIPIAMYHYKEH